MTTGVGPIATSHRRVGPWPGPGDAAAPLAVVADDDAVIRALVARILEGVGLRCLAVGSGDDAMRLIAGLAPAIDLLVSDVEMPGAVDGIGLATWAGTWHRGLPVIVMSSDPGALEGAATLPAVVGTISKPFAPSVVAHAALAALGAARGALTCGSSQWSAGRGPVPCDDDRHDVLADPANRSGADA